MDELAQLMDELTLALKKRAEVGAKSEKLAREVRQLPNLSLIAPGGTADGADDVVNRLYHKLQIQNLIHAKQEALNAMQEAVAAVTYIRQRVNDIAGQGDEREAELVEEYTDRIRHEQDVFAEIQERKRDLLFEFGRKLQKIQCLQRKAETIEHASPSKNEISTTSNGSSNRNGHRF